MRRRTRRKVGVYKLKIVVKYLCMLGFSLFIIAQILSQLQLTTLENTISWPEFRSSKRDDAKIGELGEAVINMLPEDLAFTLFLPSERALERDLRLMGENANQSFAILTRVLGFSAVPKWIRAADLEVGKELICDSVSGFRLYITKDSNQTVFVSGVASELVDLSVGKYSNTLVHVMDGIVMDSEFEESMRPEIDQSEI